MNDFMKKRLDQIVSTISMLKKQYEKEGFEIVGIFGSYAKKKENEYSDIDIAYKLNFSLFDETYKGGFAKLLRIEEIKKELQQTLQIKVDLAPIDTPNKKFYEELKRDIVYV